MAHRSSRGVVALVVLTLLAAACSAATVDETTTSSSQTSTTSTSSTTTTTLPVTTTLPITTTTAPVTTTTIGVLPEIDAVVKVPEGEGPFPAVVLAHGGGWVAGTPGAIQPLANELTDNGYLSVNTPYQLSTFDVDGFPKAVEDVACAVRYARAHPDSDGTVAVIGHSAGAHIGAIVALTGDDYVGNCSIGGSALPERFVGLAGPYDIDRLGLAMVVFFGGGPNVKPEVWEAGNPQRHTDANPDLDALIMYGEFDGLVDTDFALDFGNGLTEGGAVALIERVEGARHTDMSNPDWVGDLILTWLDR